MSCGGRQPSLKKDFQNGVAVLEMQVLGILGKTLTGPWTKTFYTAADVQVAHVEAIPMVRQISEELKCCSANPLSILSRTSDFFGHDLSAVDTTLQKLRVPPSAENKPLFSQMVVACISAVISVLERQYKRYFDLNVTENLREETKSARSRNIDAEEVMGMFSAGKHRAKNATISFLSARMRAKKNRDVPYLDGLYKTKGNARSPGQLVWRGKRGSLIERCRMTPGKNSPGEQQQRFRRSKKEIEKT